MTATDFLPEGRDIEVGPDGGVRFLHDGKVAMEVPPRDKWPEADKADRPDEGRKDEKVAA